MYIHAHVRTVTTAVQFTVGLVVDKTRVPCDVAHLAMVSILLVPLFSVVGR